MVEPFIPAEFPVTLLFTTAENERWAETRTNLKNYVYQAMAQFATGQLDVDRDWDAYVRSIKALGSDQMLAADRAAYARMKKR